MKLKFNSLTARLYRWFYMESGMPENLCPYFWKLVLMWLLMVPTVILTLPVITTKQKPDGAIARLILGFALWVFFGIVIVALAPITIFFWGFLGQKSVIGNLQAFGIFLWVVILMVSIIFGVVHLLKTIKDRRNHIRREWVWDHNGDYVKNPDYIPYEPQASIIIEFIKAKYKKYCPKIEWSRD